MEQRIERLLKWLKKSDEFYLSPNVGVIESEGSGRGVVLKNGNLRKHDVIVSVPSHYQLNYYTILWNISLFNSELKIDGVTVNENEKEKYAKMLQDDDPRFQIYSSLDQTFLLSLTSFQIFEIYIMVEWILLPLWSEGRIESFWQRFFDVWPSAEELSSIPAIWSCSPSSKDKNLLPFLPSASCVLLKKKIKLIDHDWALIHPWLASCVENFRQQGQETLPQDELYQKFLEVYFIINSRCLYSKVLLRKGDEESQFTMVPFVDFLNHTEEINEHCYPKVGRTPKAQTNMGPFSLRCGERGYNRIGDEILLNYGPHSNDFLLNEYGFVLEKNQWNYIDISEDIQAMLEGKSAMISFLKHHDYWGDYTINHSEISYRVIVVFSLFVTKDYKRMDKFLSGFISEDYFWPKIEDTLRQFLTSLCDKIRDRVEKLEDMRAESYDFSAQNVVALYMGYMDIIEHHLDRL